MKTVQLLLLLVALCAVAQGKRLVFENRLGYTIWVGSLGNSGKPPIRNGGWQMGAGSQETIDIPDDWAGRFWGRTGCNFDGSGNGHCETGDCGNRLECGGNGGAPPVTLAEFTFSGWQGQDFYDISLVDGFNLPATISTIDNVGGGDHYRCNPAACPSDINPTCPNELRQIEGGRTVACKSACLAFNTDEYCCRGDHGTPQTCQSNTWPFNYPAFFKSHCPDAYSYAYDDVASTFTCENTAYRIQFG